MTSSIPRYEKTFSARREGVTCVRPWGLLGALLFVLLSLTACAESGPGDDGPIIPDYHAPDGDTPVDGDRPDGDDGPGSDGDLLPDGDESPDGDLPPDGDAPDGDVPSDGDEDPIEPDGDTPDGDEPDGDEPEHGCRRFSDCPLTEVCNFSLGRCERRRIMPDQQLAVFGFHPPSAAPGEVLVIDGQGFYQNVLGGGLLVSLRIGDTVIPAMSNNLLADENRVIVEVPTGASGRITVFGESGNATTDAVFTPAPTGVLPCDGTTPVADGAPGASQEEVGPYAAGFFDIRDLRARVYYPAQCGSLRRPAVEGHYPVVALLHGNGAGYINYEYLGQILATWGFVSIMPSSDMDMDPQPDIITHLKSCVNTLRGQDDLGELHPALSGVSTTDQVAFVGHSRGTARTQWVVSTPTDPIARDTVACVFLGPVDDGHVVPGHFMVLGATGDRQSTVLHANEAYSRQSAPRWKVMIQGGNHSLFSDHKVWFGFMSDAEPLIERQQQLRIVVEYVLPLFQRAFGLEEPFAAQLDSPPSDPLTVVEYEL